MVARLLPALLLIGADAARGTDLECLCRFAVLHGGESPAGGFEMRARQVVATYPSGAAPADHQGDCNARCTRSAQGDAAFADREALCARVGLPLQGGIVAIAELTAKPPVSAFALPLRCCAAPVASCPAGWSFDSAGPAEKKCRRKAGFIDVQPPPPNRTPIGTWGVVIGPEVWQWGPVSAPKVRPEVVPCP